MLEVLGGVGCFLSGVAAWITLFSPRAKARRNKKKIQEERDQQIYEALYGHAAVYDNSSSLIKNAQQGILADVREMKDDVKSLKDRMDEADRDK